VLDPNGSYAVVVFTNHLPDFGTTPEGAITRPWARLQTTRNYLTMIRLIAQHDAKVVLSFSPTLLEGISAGAAGMPDQAAVVTAVPAAELTTEERAYIHDVFFLASPAQIDHFPRYRELADRYASGRTLSTAEYRDLQALFNLAWTSPLLLEEEPLLGLAAKGRGFTEADKALILETHQAALNEFLDSVAALAAAGSIELATTPLADPVLPLLVRNRMEEDAAEHITRGHDVAAEILGRAPVGLVPQAGLIDQANLPAVNAAGYRWMLLAGEEGQQPTLITSEDGTLLALPAGPGHNMRVVRRAPAAQRPHPGRPGTSGDFDCRRHGTMGSLRRRRGRILAEPAAPARPGRRVHDRPTKRPGTFGHFPSRPQPRGATQFPDRAGRAAGLGSPEREPATTPALA
jgi:hypothetical protein